MDFPGKIRMVLMVLALAVFVGAHGACATAPAGEQEDGREPITVHIDNLTSRVVTVDRIMSTMGARGSTSFGNVMSQSERPVTQRVGLVQGQSKRTLTVPWHPSRLAHQILWLEGVARIATNTETLGPGRHGSSYQVEECRGEGLRACVATSSLHLPPGAEVTLVIDQRHEARMFYNRPPPAS